MILNESAKKEITACLNEARKPQKNERPDGVAEWTFADWFGEDLSGQTYEGDIMCAYAGLTSLKGAPKIVNGSFNCSFNKLTSLEGVSEVVRLFLCSHNQLTSLEGGPKKVGGGFYCNDNQLTSLEGAPEEVGGDFGCSNNRLTSLEGAPREVNGDFKCENNRLTSLRGIGSFSGRLFCSGNKVSQKEMKTGSPEVVKNVNVGKIKNIISHSSISRYLADYAIENFTLEDFRECFR